MRLQYKEKLTSFFNYMRIHFNNLHRLIYVSLFGAVMLSSCAIYRPDIHQGQITDVENVERVETGMTKNEVQAILGTPLLVDTFNPDRWDYILTIVGNPRNIVLNERVTIYFENNRVREIEQEGKEKPDEETTTQTE